ncbi:MAG: thiol-disulfide isomerase [Blastocatellia bacterium]
MKKRLLSLCTFVTVVIATFVFAASLNEGRSSVITFTKDVAPILYKNCVECHRSTGVAPMALLNYKEVRPWAKSIKERIVDRSMPPWFADPKHGEFANNPSLSPAEINAITAWVDAGAPKGDDKDLPPAPRFTEGWAIGEPDLVLSMKEEYSVPADGVVPYLYFRIPTNFTEDRWVQAVEIKPGDQRVVHHVIATLEDAQRKRVGGLGGITPNKRAIISPPGSARLVKAGAVIVLQMHYTTVGVATKDRTSVGLIFTKERPKIVLGGGNAMNTRFVIPAGASNHEVRASKTFEEDVYLYSMMPHMHVRGKDFTYTAVYPDGRSEIVLRVPRYNFDWQLDYELKKPLFLPKGTRLDCVAHFDNSAKNKFNPDPTKDVRWGDQTWEEMMIGWYTTVRSLDPAVKVDAASSSR